jgi:hypothetical protein
MSFRRAVLARFRTCVVIAISFFLLAHAGSAFGQVDEGSVTGTILDSTGAVIPNALVTLVNTDQGLSLETHATDTGSYTFSPVRIGHYSLKATAPGFSTTTQENLTVAVGQNLQVNVSLTTGQSSEAVTVTTAPPQLQTDESSVGQVVDEHTVNSLPLNGRNFTFLAQLSAGVNVSQADTRGNAASGAFTANGLQASQNNYLLDGIDNNSNAADFLNGTNYIILPPVDAIQEFKVQTADFSAELGRSAGAVLNATIKSGTNQFHGAAWEFFRNDKLDAADWFEDNAGIKKGEFRQNQFGGSIGGPILKNKAFFFGDYEGLRRVQGTVQTGTVPTAAERNSGFTDLSSLLNNSKTRTDDVGRMIPLGTVMDPATTRAVTAGAVDPVSGRVATSSGFVRDPINTNCPASSASFAGCTLNQLPAGRLDANAIKLLNLFPLPQNGATFTSSPSSYEHRNAFDTRVDFNPTQKDQAFVRFSFADDPDFIPGIFGGVADGGGFQQGLQTARSEQGVLAYTHVFTPTAINVARVGINHLHTTRFGPDGGTAGIPAQYGIQGIPQQAENGGLPAIVISGLSTLGSNDFLPSDEVSQTLQIADDFTKIYGKNTFKAGFEYQAVHFNTLQPAYSRGEFDFTGNFEGVPGQSGDNLGLAQMLITPEATTVTGGTSYVGGANQVQASNISKVYDLRHYTAGYFQDDLKVSTKLTLNLGLRYDFFTPISETNGGQANFVQSGPPNGGPTYLVPASGKDDRSILLNNQSAFDQLLAQDGIALDVTDKYGKGLGLAQKVNFGPRAGFAYEVSNKLVARGGIGLFFNAFENAGFGPNIGRNFPFAFSFDYGNGITDSQPFAQVATAYSGCATAGPGGSATIGAGLSCSNFTPALVNPAGLGLSGLQFNFKTPNTVTSNVSLQYAVTQNLSATAAYVYTHASHLQVGVGNNEPSQLLPVGTSLTGNLNQPISATNPSYIPFRDFGENGNLQETLGASIYNGLQLKLEQRSYRGLSALVTYTYSKTLTNAFDLLNGGSLSGFRAPYVPGLGPRFDWGPAAFDVRNVFHFSGGYELPVGRGKQFMGNASKLTDEAIGGWSLNFISTLEGGQPITLTCPSSTTSGTNCNDVRVAGQSQKLGIHTGPNPDGPGIRPFWFGNPLAFQQPCPLGGVATTGCVPATGSGVLGYNSGTTVGPGFHRLDLSLFKQFPINERFRMEFRSEFFNILNHPNFNAPNFGGNGVVAIGGSGNFNDPHFGEIGSTRDAPNDPRQIQFALKLYY